MEGQMIGAGSGQQGNIGLAVIIDFAIQRTYHELGVLSELLPRKTDMERKIEIVQFAHRTRQLFVRLLALVKWAKNGCKIDKCMAISNYLDQQAMLYIDTADRLSKLARGTLVQARLPAFSIPVAVDVLTSGTYPRLPRCIREKIIPPDAITSEEESSTLKRLTQIIEYRLVTSDIPRAFKTLTVYNGRVKLLVDKEFSAELTVMGDYPTLPWRLLDIEILVEDLDTRDGKPLVHTMQIQYLHTLVQSRLVDTDTPLQELYIVLHTFCQSLQLEVLHSQAQKMIHEQLNSSISIERYIPCKKLLFSYWRPRHTGHPSQMPQYVPAVYKIDIHVNESDPYKPLSITHSPTPPANTALSYKLQSNQLSIEKILLDTIHAWSNVRLTELQQRIQELNIATDFEISDLPPTLTFKILKPCMGTECVRIAVDCIQGRFLVSLANLGAKNTLISELQTHLNLSSELQKPDTIKQLLQKLKLWLGIERCRSSVQYICTLCHDSLPLIQSENHPIAELGNNLLYIKVPLQQTLYVVVTVDLTSDPSLSLSHRYYLLPVSACTYSGDSETTDLPKMYLKPGQLTRIDRNALNILDNADDSTMDVDGEEIGVSAQRRGEESSYFVSQLISVVNQCEWRAVFVTLAESLSKEKISHTGLQEEDSGSACKLTILRLPNLGGEADELITHLLQATIRADFETMHWNLEYLFSKNPTASDEFASNQCLYTYDMKSGRGANTTVDDILRDWRGMVKLYNICAEYSQQTAELKQAVNLHKFSYKSLQLIYGADKNYLVTLSWQGDKKPNGEKREYPFEVKFSMYRTNVENTAGYNPHNLTSHFLEYIINSPSTTLAQFMKVLCDTVKPLAAINRLPEISAFGLQHSSKSIPQASFTILVQSATFIRISYRHQYLIDITLCEGDRVLVRDGAYSLFDSQPVAYTNNYVSAQGLKMFLASYEENVQSQLMRNQSMAGVPATSADEENPQTPSNLQGLDGLESLLSAPARPSPPMRQDPSPKPTFQNTNSPAVAPSPLGGFGSPLDIPITSPALHSPANMPAASPASNVIAASPYHHHGTPQGLDSSQNSGAFSSTSPKPAWMNSPAAGSQANSGGGNYSLSPRAGTSGGLQQTSPSMNRLLPQRSGYIAPPTALSHDSLLKILTPSTGGSTAEGSGMSHKNIPCPLERFLGSALLKRHLTKVLNSDVHTKITVITSGVEPGTVMWNSDSLQYRVNMNSTSQALQLTVTGLPTSTADPWLGEDLRSLEKYFSQRVANYPYKQNNMLSFCRMTAAPAKCVRDFIQIIKHQMAPEAGHRWRVEWCLTAPHEASRRLERGDKSFLETGVGALVVQPDKLFFVLRFTRHAGETGGEAITQFSLPLLYEINTDTLSLAEKHNNIRPEAVPIIQAINGALQNVKQQQQIYQQNKMTGIYAVVKEILPSLVIPPPQQAQQGQAGPPQGQPQPGQHMPQHGQPGMPHQSQQLG